MKIVLGLAKEEPPSIAASYSAPNPSPVFPMRRFALLLAAGAALGAATPGCTDSQARRVRHTLQRSSYGPQSPPPAPSGPVETEEAARSVAIRYARDHGIPVERTYEAKVYADGRWVVELRGAGDENRVWVAVDAATGRIVRARLRKPAGGLVLHAHDGYRDEDYGTPAPAGEPHGG